MLEPEPFAHCELPPTCDHAVLQSPAMQSPDALALPTTSSLCAGVTVPTPTLPSIVTCMSGVKAALALAAREVLSARTLKAMPPSGAVEMNAPLPAVIIFHWPSK